MPRPHGRPLHQAQEHERPDGPAVRHERGGRPDQRVRQPQQHERARGAVHQLANWGQGKKMEREVNEFECEG